MKKKKWRKPKVVILVRSKPEEMVLASCKFMGPLGSGSPSLENIGCIGVGFPDGCASCSSSDSS